MSGGTSQPTADTQSGAVVLVDAHVHLYDCFDRAAFFDGASNNFRSAASSLGLPGDTHGVLLFTEMSGVHAFESLIAQHELNGGRWRFHPASEGRTLVAALEGKDVLTIVAGRQVVTREGLEVLSLCCSEQFTDGQAIEHTIEKIIEAGGLPVLSYGVGKWSGSRGKIIDRLIRGALGSRLMLGDNAGRLWMGGEPKQFAEARQRGMWVLPGTDPLPFADQASRVGRYGMMLCGEIDRDRPAASIQHLIRSAEAQPRVYGTTDGPLSFLKLQIAMQVRKRLIRR